MYKGRFPAPAPESHQRGDQAVPDVGGPPGQGWWQRKASSGWAGKTRAAWPAWRRPSRETLKRTVAGHAEQDNVHAIRSGFNTVTTRAESAIGVMGRASTLDGHSPFVIIGVPT